VEYTLLFLVRTCIIFGNVIIRLLGLLGQLILAVLAVLQKLLSYLFEKFFKVASSVLWFFFKRSRSPKKRFLTLNYVLFFYRVKYFALGFAIAIIILMGNMVTQFINQLPSPAQLESYRAGLSTHLYSRDGKLLYEVFREENRTPIKLSSLPRYLKEATISIEDKEFYNHGGISLFGGVLRAFKENLFESKLQGGSTITQQLVKSALLTPERTITRKIKEMILALLVERKYTKDEILEMYLNQVPYGGTAWGIEEASRMYLHKSATKLSLSEAALLAGLPQAPSLYSPYTNPKAAKARQAQVLSQMLKERYITKLQYQKAIQAKLNVQAPKSQIKAPHFVFYVKQLLEQEYGEKTVQEGGLRVYTTLDYSIQKAAENILKEELEKLESYNVGNGAILVSRPSTGEILAMVGSRDFFEGTYGAYNVTTALRQPGSSIKPLTYTLALKNGMTAGSILADVPTTFGIPGSEVYRPVNYDGRFHGNVPVRYALANSYNIPAVKALESVGVENFINFAQNLGIENWQQDPSRYGLSLTLGGGEVTMLEMATAFGTLRNLGSKVDLNPVNRIENSAGQLFYINSHEAQRVLGEEEPFIISDILSDNLARTPAFGANSPLNFGNGLISVKTGTTDEKKDNWTIGYTRPTLSSQYGDVLVAVWVGNNDNTPMNPNLASGITGAAPIWRRVMERLVDQAFLKESLYFPAQIEKKICYFGRVEYFVEGTSGKINCFGYQITPSPRTQ
jgi:1A family penicillin-binding protein